MSVVGVRAGQQGQPGRIARVWALAAGLMVASGGDEAGASEPAKVPKPIPVSAGALLADAFKSEAGDRVFFAESSVALGARARVALEAQAAWLKRHTSVRVIIEGYSDDPGGDGANAALARERAEVVHARLLALGVPAERMQLASFGQSVRAVVCADAACAAPNRRVVTRIAVPSPPSDAAPPPAPEPVQEMAQPGIRPSLRRLF